MDNEFFCYSNELHSHLPFDRLWFELLCAQYTLRTKIINWLLARYVTPAMLVVYTQAKISHLVASLPTSRQQVVFALLVPSCQESMEQAVNSCNNRVDIIRHVARLFPQDYTDTVMIHNNIVTILCRQHCSILVR
jgi:hypothetical protein